MPITQSTLTTSALYTPTGVVELFGGTVIPQGWLVCDGSSVSRTIYPALWQLIGISFGAPSDTSTFKLPDLRGRTPVGYAKSGGHSDVSTLGNSDSTALANRRPAHNHTNGITFSHTLKIPDHSHGTVNISHSHSTGNNITGNGNYTGAGGSQQGQGNTESTGGASPGGSVGNATGTIGGSIAVGGYVGATNPSTTSYGDAHPYLVLHYIIKT